METIRVRLLKSFERAAGASEPVVFDEQLDIIDKFGLSQTVAVDGQGDDERTAVRVYGIATTSRIRRFWTYLHRDEQSVNTAFVCIYDR